MTLLALLYRRAILHQLPRSSFLRITNTNTHNIIPYRSSLPRSQTQSYSLSRTMSSATKFYDFKPLDKRGQPYDFSQLKGKVVLVVNTASKCGFTPQFAGLEALYKSLKSDPDPNVAGGFEILGFPCNQFGGQDPGSNDTIQEFCTLNYGVSFPVLGKTEVNGDKTEPLYAWLKAEKPGIMGLTRIKWNFEKFLVGKDGEVKGRWASTTKPEGMREAIVKELRKGGVAGLSGVVGGEGRVEMRHE